MAKIKGDIYQMKGVKWPEYKNPSRCIGRDRYKYFHWA
jgi:hypothetical protein